MSEPAAVIEAVSNALPSAFPLASTLVLAHSGHWLVTSLYLVPVVLFLGWLAVVTIRERRDERAGRTGPARKES